MARDGVADAVRLVGDHADPDREAGVVQQRGGVPDERGGPMPVGERTRHHPPPELPVGVNHEQPHHPADRSHGWTHIRSGRIAK